MLAFAREERKEITRDRLLKLATDVLPIKGLAVDRVNAAAHCLSKAEAVMQPRQRIEMTGANGGPVPVTDRPSLTVIARKVALAFYLASRGAEGDAGDGRD
jgi:hypothetical protein